MARQLDPGEQDELTSFVNALYERAGYTRIAAWAADAGLPASNLSKLRNRRGGIDGYNLLKLINAAALRAGVPAVDLAVGASQRSVAQRLDELADGVAFAIDLLQAIADPGQIAGDGRSRAKRRRK